METSRVEGVSTRRDAEIAQGGFLNLERLRKIRQIDALEECGVEVELLPGPCRHERRGAVGPLDLDRISFSRLYRFDDRDGLLRQRLRDVAH